MKEQNAHRIGSGEKGVSKQAAFTLIEMLVVISIIVLLASLIFPAIQNALRNAQQTRCLANLNGLGKAWNVNYLEVMSGVHQNELDAIFPWLSNMVPEFAEESVLRCPADESGGRYGSQPLENDIFATAEVTEYPETDDTPGNHPERNPDVDACSYLYEFNAASCSWWGNWGKWGILSSDGQTFATDDDANIDGGPVTWAEAKLAQLRNGDNYSMGPYDPTQFPLIRCFHHYRHKNVTYLNTEDNVKESGFRVINVSLAGNVFLSSLQWEYPLAP